MKAGVARTLITPENPIALAGYAARSGPSKGVYHDLFAKALVLEEGDDKAVIITTDLIGFDPTTCQEVKTAISQLTGLAPQQVILSASHTHTGPEISIENKEHVESFDEVYVRALIAKIANAVNEACQRTEPVTLDFAKTSCTLAVNRRLPTPEGMAMRPNPAGISDHEVCVLRIRRSDASPLAILVSYPCHPTTLGDYLIGGDYPGFAQTAIETEFENCVAMFIQGCAGDQKVRHVDAKGGFKSGPYQAAESFGEELARAVLVALCGPTTPVAGDMTIKMSEVDLPFQAPPSRAEAEKMAASGDKYLADWGREMLRIMDSGEPFAKARAMTVQTLQIGYFALIAMAAEVCVGYSLELKRKYAGRPLIVSAYTNGMIGYVPTASMMPEGGYEVTQSHYYDLTPASFAPEIEQAIYTKVHELLDLTPAGAAKT